MSAPAQSLRPLPLFFAFLGVYVLWGSTYLAIKLVVQSLPPLTLAGIRFTVAGSLMYALLRFRGAPAPNQQHWKGAWAAGTLLVLGGNGLISVAARWIDSGMLAVLAATNPLYMTLFGWWSGEGRRPGWITWMGLLMGLIGIVLLVNPSLGGDQNWRGFAFGLSAPMLWAAGSLLGRRVKQPESTLLFASMQMITGGLACFLVAAVSGEIFRADWTAGTAQSWWAVAYLLVFGSWLGFSCFILVTKYTPPVMSSTYSYVNPVIAVLLGRWLLQEELTPDRLMGMALTLAGVVLVIWRSSRRTPRPDYSGGSRLRSQSR
jgi:drug/metabolite transporter (DMT)-like permease